MHKFVVFILVIATLLGVLLVGRGISGFVTAQSCCFLPNCDAEDVCSVASEPRESQSLINIYVGGTFIVCSLLVYLLMHTKNRRK